MKGNFARHLPLLVTSCALLAFAASLFFLLRSHGFSIEKAPLKLVEVQPGTYTMGNKNAIEDTEREVTLTAPFYCGTTEITQQFYSAVMHENPSNFKGDNLPVECVNWREAMEFCRKLTESERARRNLPDGMVYRLPTEAEWEYCYRAGTRTLFYFGDDERLLKDYEWFWESSSESTTAPVGTKKPNPWGIYDMGGNVSEWCLSYVFGASYTKLPASVDPIGPARGTWRVTRGASWDTLAEVATSGYRQGNVTDCRSSELGFRVVLAREIPVPGYPLAPRPPLSNKVVEDPAAFSPIRLVAISPGEFKMGSENGENDETPVRLVTITRAFYIGATEVTQAQFQLVTNLGPDPFRGPNLPAQDVSWDLAVDFCQALTEYERAQGHLPKGMEYRLPTEAEWEYCCRAGTDTTWFFGSFPDSLGDYAWIHGNTDPTKAEVGTKKPNPWGIYDMLGSVEEWCQDWYARYPPRTERDPVGPPTGVMRVLRGGSWCTDVSYCRSASRLSGCTSYYIFCTGFRVVLGPILEKK